MTITKTCKKIMAFMLSIALVLSVLFIPKLSSAAGETPEITVLGSSLKLDAAGDGTQALRLAVRVDNANAAKACAITIKSGTTSYTVSTRPVEAGVVDKQAYHLYSKDETNNSIVYAVSITNIPTASFGTEFEIIGKAWGLDNTLYTSATVTKSINQTAAGIAAAFPALDIVLKDDGVLYKNGGNDALVKEDLATQPPAPTDTPQPTDVPQPTATPEPQVTDTELDQANLVTNGNFANGKTGWDQNGGSTSAVVVDYTNCLLNSGRWNSYSGPRTHLTGDFNIGDVLTYQFKIKRQSSLEGLSGSDNYFIIKFSETGTEHTSKPTSNSDGTTNAVCDNEHWTTCYGTYTVQETTDSITVIVMENNYVAYGDSNPSSNYSFYLDDVQIVRTYAAPSPSPTPVPTATPEASAWNDNYETQAKYELWTPSGTTDTGMLGKEVIFVALAEDNKVYAMSASGSTITKTDITDMYFGDTIYIPTDYNLYNISWSTMWNKADGNPDMLKGYLFQNMEDEKYLGIWGVEVSAQGMPTGMTSGNIDYKKRFTWSSTLYANYKTSNFLHFDGTDFDADASASNVLCYVKSYTGDHAVKNTWHQVDEFTTGREYLLVTAGTAGTAKAFCMTGTGSGAYGGKDVTINADGTITYDGAYNDSAVVNAHSLSDGTFYLNTWIDPTVRQTLSYKGDASADRSLYITSDNSLQDYAFRFKYASGALKAYYGSSGLGTEMPVRWSLNGSTLVIGTASSNTGEFFIFERDMTPQDYTPPVPTGREYSKITDVSQIQDGDKIVMIFDGQATGTNFGPEFMIPEGVEINNRIGFNVVSTDITLGKSIYGDSYEAYEWTFTKSGSGWLVGTSAGNVKFTTVSGKGITATLESEGSVLTISGSDVYTFYNGDNCFNRNTTRTLINAYAGQPAHFYLYRYAG